MVYYNQGKGIDTKEEIKMTYTFTFNGLNKEQENKFNEIIKSVPFDLVATFEEWVDLMGLELVIKADKHITELVVKA